MKSYVKEVNKAKAIFIKEINSLFKGKFKAYESQGNFVLVNCGDIETKKALIYYLEENNIFIRAVSQSESVKNCVRITIGTQEQMVTVIQIIKDFVNKIK